MIVYVLFGSYKICFKEKSLYYFHKKLKIKKNPKTQKTHFYWVFLCGFFGWVFLGGFFICNPACAKSRRFMWRSTRSGQRSSSPHRVPCTMGGIFKKQIDNLLHGTSKQRCGSGMLIPDPWSKRFRIRIKELKYFFNPKTFF